MNGHLRQRHVCPNCAANYWTAAEICTGEDAATIRARLKAEPKTCPHCTQRAGLGGDLFPSIGPRCGLATRPAENGSRLPNTGRNQASCADLADGQLGISDAIPVALRDLECPHCHFEKGFDNAFGMRCCEMCSRWWFPMPVGMEKPNRSRRRSARC